MILGIGSDIADARRIAKVIDRHGDRFLDRIFTPIERARADKRRNRVETFVSELIAQATGRWESYATSDLRPYAGTIHVDAGELRNHVQRNRAYYSAIRKALTSTGQPHDRSS